MIFRSRLVLTAAALTVVAGTATAGIVTANAAEPTAGPKAAAAPGATATFAKTQEWGSGYVADFAIRNGGSSPLTSWRVEFTLPAGTTVGSFWDATVAQSGQRVVAVNRDYNARVAAGDTVRFGFVASGTGAPSGCTINGAACEGGSAPSPSASPSASAEPTPSASPTASPKPTPTQSAPPAVGGRVFAPYVQLSVNGRPSLTQLARDTGAKAISLAFVINAGSGCDLKWDGTAAIDTYKDEIAALKAAGVEPIVSTGGANGSEVAVGCRTASATAAQLEKVLALGIRYLDFDVEGGAVGDATANTARGQAIKQLQQKYPDLKVSLTLASLPPGKWGEPGGVQDKDKVVWTAAVAAGARIDRINIMTMNFGSYYDEGKGTTVMGQKSIEAARDLQQQIKEIHQVSDATAWRMVGITPMIGVNDTTTEIFQLANIAEVVDFARANGVGMLSFWSLSRDKACAAGTPQPSPVCSGVAQQPNQYARGFAAVQN